jgi:hypothetical protein
LFINLNYAACLKQMCIRALFITIRAKSWIMIFDNIFNWRHIWRLDARPSSTPSIIFKWLPPFRESPETLKNDCSRNSILSSGPLQLFICICRRFTQFHAELYVSTQFKPFLWCHFNVVTDYYDLNTVYFPYLTSNDLTFLCDVIQTSQNIFPHFSDILINSVEIKMHWIKQLYIKIAPGSVTR